MVALCCFWQSGAAEKLKNSFLTNVSTVLNFVSFTHK